MLFPQKIVHVQRLGHFRAFGTRHGNHFVGIDEAHCTGFDRDIRLNRLLVGLCCKTFRKRRLSAAFVFTFPTGCR